MALLAPTPASATKVADTYCLPSGESCTAVLREHGRIELAIRSFAVTKSYQLCVRPPGSRLECHSYRMTRVRDSLYASKIDFARHFSHSRHGRYVVKWKAGGTRAIGRPLHFRH